MKRRHLVVLVSAATLLTIIFVAAVTIGVGVGTDAGRNQIRALIEQQVSSRVTGSIHIGRIRGSLLTGVTIDSFAIRDAQDSLLLSTGSVTLQYDPRDLLDRRLLLRNVELENPKFRLRQYEDGSWNFQHIFKSDGPSAPGVPGRGYGDYAVLEDVRVKNGEFVLIRPWSPDDSLRGAKRDSAIAVNLANADREIRRVADGYTHTYRWTRASAVLPRVRIAHPDSAGQFFAIRSLHVEEKEPPFSFRNATGTVRKLGDSVFVDVRHFDLPASTGSAQGKIWWGSGKPIRLDLRIIGDSVSLRDVAWVYPTLPREGGGRTKLHITNDRDNLSALRYALSEMDVRSTKSRLTGAMTFVIGNPVLEVRDVDLRASPVNFDLLRTLAGEAFSVDWQGDLVGHASGPGGPLTHFVVNESEMTWRDTHVPGAVSRLRGSGALNILEPEFTVFRGFDVDVARLDLRSIQFLFPEFPRLGGAVSGIATLDSSWLDVRFSNADVAHSNGPGEPTRLTGAGRVTWAEEFMTYDVAMNAQPLSLDMMSRAYPLGLTGLMSGPIQAKGTTENLQVTAQLEGPAGRITYSGTVDAYPLSVAARGSGRMDGLDASRLVAAGGPPPGFLTGTYQVDIRGDTNDLGTLRGSASALIERSELSGIRIYPSRMRVHFADGRMYVDTLRVESTAGRIDASGALGLTTAVRDTVTYYVMVDSLGGLRRYIDTFTPGAAAANAPADSISGTLSINGTAFGSLQSLDLAGTLSGSKLFVRREAGREINGSFALTNLQSGPTGTASVRFDKLNFRGIALDTVGIALTLTSASRGAFSFGARAINGVTLAASGDLAMADSLTSVVLREVDLATDSSRWTLRGASTIDARVDGFAIDSLVLANGAGGRLGLEVSVPDSGKARMLMRADSIPLRDIGRIAQLRRPLSGWATITAQGAGTSTAPVMNMQAVLRGVQWGGLTVERVTADGEYTDNRARVGMDLARGGRTVVLARGSLPVELQYFGLRLLQDSLRATIRTDSANFDVIEAFVPGLSQATGQLVANLDVAGTWGHPDITGALRVANGDVFVDSLGIRLRGVNLDMQMFGHADSLAIRRFVAWSGASSSDSMSLHGYVAYRDLDNPYLDLTLEARSFYALDKRSLARLYVSTEPLGLRLRGQLRGATLRGGLVVDRGSVYLPDPDVRGKQVVDYTSTLRDSASNSRGLSASDRLLQSIIIDAVRVTLGDDVWLRSTEADIKLGGTLNVQRHQRRTYSMELGTLIDTDSSMVPALDGVLRAERGTYTLGLGLVQREFQVEGGTITFFGSHELAPELDISALHTVRTVNADDLRIRVRLTGPLYPNPIISLESAENFALSQSDVVSYLIFGQPNFQLGEESRSYTALAVATLSPSLQSLAAAQLRSWVGSGADFITLRPGSANADAVASSKGAEGFDDFFWNSRLGYEQQISDNLFVSVTAGLCQLRGQETSAESSLLEGLSGKLEYRISRDASIKAGKEPSNAICRPAASAGRIVQTPSQWGLSLFKTWRF